MDHTLVTTLHINSRDRISGTPGNFRVRFTPTITNCVGVAVKSATIAYSYYNINTGNNVLQFSENGGATLSITIPQGNYTSSLLASSLGSLLTAASGIGYTYSCTISALDYRCRIQITDPAVAETSFLFSQNTSLARILGFLPQDTISVTDIYSTYPVNLTGSQKLYVMSNALTSSASSIAYSNGTELPILTEVPVSVGPNNTIIYLPTVEYWGGFTANLSDIDITLVDDAFVPIDLNGVDWNISVAIKRKNAFV